MRDNTHIDKIHESVDTSQLGVHTQSGDACTCAVATHHAASKGAIGGPPPWPAQLSRSVASPRLQRCLCLLKFFGPNCPFWLQPHLHAAVTSQQSVATSAKGK